MNSTSETRRLGDYELRRLLGSDDRMLCWLAHQQDLERQVMVVELRPSELSERATFPADARAMAAADHPAIAAVYEAVSGPGGTFYTQECLPGVPLSTRQEQGERLSPLQMVTLLRDVSEVQLQLEQEGKSVLPLGLESIYREESGVMRLGNLAIAGERDPQESLRDVTHLGELLPGLMDPAPSGATRLITLFSWMRGEELETPLTWEAVHEYSRQIVDQLSGLTPPPPPREKKRLLLAMVTLLILAGLGVSAWHWYPRHAAATARQPLPAPKVVPAGTHALPDGKQVVVEEFRISSHPVTWEEYAAFLETQALLAKEGNESLFDHPEQPDTKTRHEPAGWASLWPAIRAKGGAALDEPVTGIDWWDAAAFATWKRSRLPTQEEWFAAGIEETLICEWTGQPATDPANPLGERVWVLTGPGDRQEWIHDRALRRTNVGFRLVTKE